MQQARNPLFEDYLQTDTRPAEDAEGRRVVNSNLFSSDVGQWHVQDVKIQTGREDAVPFFILAFSDGALKTRRTSMHVLQPATQPAVKHDTHSSQPGRQPASQGAREHPPPASNSQPASKRAGNQPGRPATSASQPASTCMGVNAITCS